MDSLPVITRYKNLLAEVFPNNCLSAFQYLTAFPSL
jgi:hypothetical protein